MNNSPSQGDKIVIRPEEIASAKPYSPPKVTIAPAVLPMAAPHGGPASGGVPPPARSGSGAIVLAVLGVLAMLLLFVGGLIGLAWYFHQSGAPGAAAGNSSSGSATELPGTSHDDKRQATLDYWNRVIAICEAAGPAEGMEAAVAVETFRRAAQQIEALSTQQVDAEAVDCCLQLAGVVREAAGVIERANDPGTLVDAFVRGAAGDPFGAFNDQRVAEAELKKHLEAIHQRCQSVRAALTGRYGIEFPQLKVL